MTARKKRGPNKRILMPPELDDVRDDHVDPAPFEEGDLDDERALADLASQSFPTPDDWVAIPDLESLPDEVSRPTTQHGTPRRSKGNWLLSKTFLRERLPAVLENIRLGMPFDHAVAATGLVPRTLLNWLYWGMEPNADPLLAYFAHSVMAARSQFLRRSVARLQVSRSGKGPPREGPWVIDAWLLERSFPQHFGQSKYRHASRGCIFAAYDPATTGRGTVERERGLRRKSIMDH